MITITNKKIYHSEWSLKTCKKKKIIEPTQLPFYLTEEVEFADDLTFGNFYELIIKNEAIFDIIFHRSIGNAPLKVFIDDFNNTKAEVPEDMFLEVHHVAELFKWKKEPVDFYLYTGFHGYGRLKPDPNAPKAMNAGRYGIGLGLESIGKYKNYQLKLNKELIISGKKIIKKGKLQGLETLVKADKYEFVLFNVIAAVLKELSYYGGPKHREEFVKMLNSKCSEVRESIKDGTFPEKSLSAKQFKKINKKA